MKITMTSCTNCGKRFDSSSLVCPVCGAPYSKDATYSKSIQIPDGYELYGVAERGRVVKLNHAILNGSVELRNKTSRVYAILSPKAYPILKPIIETK